MDLELIQQLISKLEASKLKKLVVKQGDFELQLEKESEFAPPIHRTVVAENATETALWAESSQKGGRGGHAKPAPRATTAITAAPANACIKLCPR